MIRAAVIQLVITFLWLSSTEALASQQNGTHPPADPIEKAMSAGVDKVNINQDQPPPTLERRNPRYKLGTGDVINIGFPFTPDFNQTVTVQPDGYITLQDVGDVHVGDKTVPEVRKDLQDAYGKILRDPVITIDLKGFEKPYFLALGQVAHPGKYDLEGDTTVAAAVTMAGGFTNKAKHSQVLLFRRVSDNWVSVKQVDLKHMLNSRDLSEDLQLQPGDLVYIPQNRVSKIKPFIPLPSLSYYLH